MKFALTTPMTDKVIKFDFDKPDGDRYLRIRDSKERLLATITVTPTEEMLIAINAAPGSGITIEGMQLDVMGNKLKPVDPAAFNGKSYVPDPDGNLIFTHGGKQVGVKIATNPGPAVPVGHVDEIMGQPGMIYALACSIALGKHSALSGPTGVGKTTVYRWLAQQLGYNLVLMPISRGTEASHLVGDYVPTGPGKFEWTDGPVTTACRLSQSAPTILVFDELNRVGNIAEFARIYSVLDDTKRLTIPEHRDANGNVEVIDVGELYIGATLNPADDDHADYIGVQELDPALISRFPIQPMIAYPAINVESQALAFRVPTISVATATAMVNVAGKVRSSSEIRFPFSFRELEAWARLTEYMSMADAFEWAVVSKAPLGFREAIRAFGKLVTGGVSQ